MAVFSDCDSTGTNIKSSGHVTFVFGKLLDKNTYIGLGGNQGDMITLSPNYQFHGKAFPMNIKKTAYKIFRGFYKPKGYIVKSEDTLIHSDNYATAGSANKKIRLDSLRTITGEKDD
ncbi:hypothetical protein O2K51_01260 [Apibacter raozihei]|uniref:hypothetical protein n=1 Tax=Apibacter raozihei TaxID=2500547 RepID=UPI000FE32107|nr:hypothetical protein [Apibacter raozihei]